MKRLNIWKRFLQAAGLLLFAVLILPAFRTEAKVITPDENIAWALYDYDTVTLQAGKTYHLYGRLPALNGKKIKAPKSTTIICNTELVRNDCTKTNYNSLNGFTIDGGKWITDSKDGIRNSFIKFTHAKNITLKNMTIKACNYENHTIELVACKNVTIKNCKIDGKGSIRKTSVEEAVQIDVATKRTAPYITEGDRFLNGAGCKNITISGCTIKGNRGVCASFINNPNSSEKKKYWKKSGYHSNITVKNCKITGNSAEALALFNTLNATVKGNKIICNSKRINESYSVGCHFHLFYPCSKAMMKKSKITVSGNTIKGGRQALNFDTHSNGHFGKLTVRNNKLYCKKGSGAALHVKAYKSLSKSGNSLKKW